jgi:cytochrome P450
MTASEAVSACPHFDHHDPTVRGDDYYRLYEDLRDQPVSRSDAYGGFWIVSRYDDVRAALKDHETFVSSQSVFLPPLPNFRSLGLESDPPEHSEFRKLYLDLAGRGVVSEAEPKLRAMIEATVERFFAAGGGNAVEDVTQRFPVEAIALMTGLSREASAQVRDLTVEMWQNMEDPAAQIPLLTLLMAEVEARRENPSDDFLTHLSSAQVAGRGIEDSEIANVLLSAVVAGHETTMNASGNLLIQLASSPDLQERLRREPDFIPQVIEEVLRHRAPVHVFFRTVARDVEFAGTPMKAGEKICILYGSANRDPEKFGCPERFEPDREDAGGHVTFGWGIHRCVGAPLAQMELKILTEAFVGSGEISLSGPPEPTPLEGGSHLGWSTVPLEARATAPSM